MDMSTRNARRSAFALVGGAVVLAFGSLAAPAFAAAPSNDELGGAAALLLGDHVSLDTSEATTTADDAALNDACGAPATDASVWYTYTAPDDGGVVVDASASDYSAGFMIFEGAPSADSMIGCGPMTAGFATSAGTTYTLMVFDDEQDGNAANGGDLELDVNAAPPPPTVDMSVSSKATVDKSGTAWVTGSYTCTDGDNIEIDGELHQSVGRLTINGYGGIFDEGTCDGAPHDFSMGITGDNGKFSGGHAASIMFSYACGAFECADGYAEQEIHLSKGK
jgi:hypothetical protein